MYTIMHFFPYTTIVTNYILGFQENIEFKNIFYIYGYNNNTNHNFYIPKDMGQNILIKNDTELSCSVDFNILNEKIDVIVLQSVPENLKQLEFLHDFILKKKMPVIINPWGREIYRTSDLYLNKNKLFVKKIDSLKVSLIERCNAIICAPKMKIFLENNYEMNCTYYSFNSLYGFNLEEFKNIRPRNHNPRKINIMVGHRGTHTGRHLQVFLRLIKSKKMINKVICPLSYGNERYIKKINMIGRLLFLNKWQPITKWMSRDEYFSYLNENVDVAIFNNSESEAANNIWALIYMGKSVFCSSDNDSFSMMRDLNLHFMEWNKKSLKKGFVLLDDNQIYENKKIMEEFGSKKAFQENWENVIKDVCNRR